MKKTVLNRVLYSFSIFIFLIALVGDNFISIDAYIKSGELMTVKKIKVTDYSDGYRFFPDVTEFKGTINGSELYFRHYFYPFKSHYSTKIKDDEALSRYVAFADFEGKGAKNNPIVLLPLSGDDFYFWKNKRTIQKYLLMDKVYFGFFSFRSFCKFLMGALFVLVCINLIRKIRIAKEKNSPPVF